MKLPRSRSFGQFSLLTFLFVITVVCVYIALWKANYDLAVAAVDAVAAAMIGIRIDRAHNRTGLVGSILGGTLGGLLAHAIGLAVAYLHPPFEDEGLGYVLTFLYIAPMPGMVGAGVGLMTYVASVVIRPGREAQW